MNFHKNHTWKVVIWFEKISGFWPYQSRIKNGILCSLIVILFCSFVAPLTTRAFREWGKNIYIVVENLVSIMLVNGSSFKVMSAYFYQKRRKKVYYLIKKQLEKLNEEEEMKIMTDYIEYGLKFTLVYIGFAGLTVVLIDGPAFLEMIFSIFLGNTTANKTLPYKLEYGIDQNKYYNYIVSHVMMCEIYGCIVMFAYDLSFVIIVQHSCALFEIVTRRLKRGLEVAAKYKCNEGVSTQDECEAHCLLIMTIDIHDETLQLVRFIDDAYHVSWFLKIIETVITTGALLSVMIASTNDVFAFVGYLVFVIFILIQFNVAFNRGQKVIDLSSAVFDVCCDCEWEQFSKESVYLLRVIMMRSSKESYLTGGKMFVLSWETYGKVLKTTYSYFALFNSAVKEDNHEQ